jgi:hypothetical protein
MCKEQLQEGTHGCLDMQGAVSKLDMQGSWSLPPLLGKQTAKSCTWSFCEEEEHGSCMALLTGVAADKTRCCWCGLVSRVPHLLDCIRV